MHIGRVTRFERPMVSPAITVVAAHPILVDSIAPLD